MSDDKIAISEPVADLALAALEHGLVSRWTGGTVVPFVLIASGGQLYFHRFEAETHEMAMADAEEFLSRETDSTSAYALAYDGTVTVEGTQFDAILVIAGEQGTGDAYVFTQRYDGSASPVALIGPPAVIGQHESLLNKA